MKKQLPILISNYFIFINIIVVILQKQSSSYVAISAWSLNDYHRHRRSSISVKIHNNNNHHHCFYCASSSSSSASSSSLFSSSKQKEEKIIDESFSSSSLSNNDNNLSSNLLELCNLLDVSSPNGYHKYLYLSDYNDDDDDDSNDNNNNNPEELLFQDIDTDTDNNIDADAEINKNNEEVTEERGLYIKCNIPKDEIIFQIPLSSCLTDDTPPKWLITPDHNNNYDDNDENDNSNTSNDEHYQHISNHPTHWATRLAASFINIQQEVLQEVQQSDNNENDNNNTKNNILKGFHKWISLIPSPQQLRSSLPIHWNDNILSKARCYALEICVDSMYFTRADAVDVLLNGLKNNNNSACTNTNSNSDTTTLLMEEKNLASRCHRALDIIQTRTCRADFSCSSSSSSEPYIVKPIRILAPIFDFMNHGGALNTNAYFQLEEGSPSSLSSDNELYLVIRALKDINNNDELCIHYGNENTKPTWKCLVSYGFVPNYKLIEDDDVEDEEENEVAEVFLDGVRYEVGYSTIPIDMIHAMILTIELEMNHNGDGILLPNDDDTATPTTTSTNTNNILDEHSPIVVSEACYRIAKRMSDVAFDLLLVNDDDYNDELNEDDSSGNNAKERLISLSLAAKLRYSQHRVLLTCAMNLRDYANQIKGVSL